MKLSLFSDYSLRTLMYAALKQDAFLLDEVTSAYGISRNHLAKVVHSLAKLGYLNTQRGRGGGIRLALAPEDIRLGKLIRKTQEGTDRQGARDCRKHPQRRAESHACFKVAIRAVSATERPVATSGGGLSFSF